MKKDFRGKVRDFLDKNFHPSLAGIDVSWVMREGYANPTKEMLLWRDAVGKLGWGTPTWPTQYGGGGLNREEAQILAEEFEAAEAWNPIIGMGIMMIGPTILEFGTEEQKLRHLPPIARGEIRWCQGYSEPGAGSDLASLQCFAEDKGDHFIVNGQKTWTSGAHLSQWCFALVRTDKSKKYEGISFILFDMKSKGVEIKPIKMISGSSPFCETFLNDVIVPKENLLGKLGEGWTIGKRLLQFERGGISALGKAKGVSGPTLTELAKKYIGTDENGEIACKSTKNRIIKYEMRKACFDLTLQRVSQMAGAKGPTQITSILKNTGSELTQTRTELITDIMGLNGFGWEDESFEPEMLDATKEWLMSKAVTIYGGTSEVQRNIIAKQILGLRDHQ